MLTKNRLPRGCSNCSILLFKEINNAVTFMEKNVSCSLISGNIGYFTNTFKKNK